MTISKPLTKEQKIERFKQRQRLRSKELLARAAARTKRLERNLAKRTKAATKGTTNEL